MQFAIHSHDYLYSKYAVFTIIQIYTVVQEHYIIMIMTIKNIWMKWTNSTLKLIIYQ